jgi:hypothetical protein
MDIVFQPGNETANAWVRYTRPAQHSANPPPDQQGLNIHHEEKKDEDTDCRKEFQATASPSKITGSSMK